MNENLEQLENISIYEYEVRCKTVDEFVEKVKESCPMSKLNMNMIEQIAKQMKGGV